MTTVVCAACDQTVAPVLIVFGYPTPDTFAAADRGEVVLGGCVVDGTEPDARCPACGADIRIEEAVR